MVECCRKCGPGSDGKKCGTLSCLMETGEGGPTAISMICSAVFGYFEELQRKVCRKAEECLCHCVSRHCRHKLCEKQYTSKVRF